MGSAVIIVILVLIAVYTVKSYAQKLSHGCCGAGGDVEKKVRVRDKDASHYPHCVTVGVEGMTCSRCKERVENALNAEEGVWAQVDLKAGRALVRMKQPLSEAILRKIISRAGYTATDIVPSETA